MRFLSLLICILVFPSTLLAEPPAPMADRVRILTVEMNRGPAEELAPFLAPDAHTLSRQYAIRALGRIGDRGMAPEMLADLLETEKTQLLLVLWAAGIARSKKLADAIEKHLDTEDVGVAAAAVEALGWTGADGVAEKLSATLLHPAPAVRAAALRGLARMAPEMLLERVLVFLSDSDDHVRQAAGFATWRIALARSASAKAADPEWEGDVGASATILLAMKAAPVEEQLQLIRAVGALLPPTIDRKSFSLPFELVGHRDPRIAEEVVRFVLTGRNCKQVNDSLLWCLHHDDPKLRHLAAVALAQHEQWKQLRDRFTIEEDLRLRDTLAVEIARGGDLTAWESIAHDPAREKLPETLRLGTNATALLAKGDADSLGKLMAWATPTPEHRLPPGVVVSILWGLDNPEHGAIGPWLRAISSGPVAYDDEHVIAGTIYAAEMTGDRELLAQFMAAPALPPEALRALASVLGEAASAEDCPEEFRKSAKAWLGKTVTDPASPTFVRLAARESAVALEIMAPALSDLPASDWKGLPRPQEKVYGLDLAGDSEWLTAMEILTLADRIAATNAKVVFETSAGSFTVELYPHHAPVHCASLVLSVANGLYRNTRWHRVVPSFVIQGGDPHGHGAGDAGFFLPDEIGPLVFDRGTLGMPKSRKDDGGCQLFFMMSPYARLDGNYTLYGRVAEGMEIVDRIRVGDLILDAKLVTD